MDKREKVTVEEWANFGKTKIYRHLMKNLESLKNANLEQAMDIPDKTVMPNESIAAYLNRAKGVQIVMDDIIARVKNAEKEMERGEKSRD